MSVFVAAREKVRRALFIYPIAAMFGLLSAGVIVWGGFNWSLEITNTEAFCISCHVMKNNVYEEYKKTVHYANRTGVRAKCPDCHVPKEWIFKVERKIRATGELYHWIRGSIDSREKFEAKRSQLAHHVWRSMEKTDSRECRNCHGIDHMYPETQKTEAGVMHELAQAWEMTCIDCHKGIAHTLPKDFDRDAILTRLHDRIEKEKFDCSQCHKDMAGAKKNDGWD